MLQNVQCRTVTTVHSWHCTIFSSVQFSSVQFSSVQFTPLTWRYCDSLGTVSTWLCYCFHTGTGNSQTANSQSVWQLNSFYLWTECNAVLKIQCGHWSLVTGHLVPCHSHSHNSIRMATYQPTIWTACNFLFSAHTGNFVLTIKQSPDIHVLPQHTCRFIRFVLATWWLNDKGMLS
jgi:hypothetical protein